MKFNGTVIKYGRDIDTDVIIAARYLNTSDPKELAKHCMQDLDPTFVERVKPGDINTGLAILECPEAVDGISEGDTVSVDADAGIITDETTGKSWQAQPFPPFIKEIIEAGGLVARTKNKMKEEQR